VDSPGIEPGPPWCKAGGWPPERWYCALRILRALSCFQYVGCPSTLNSICGCNRKLRPEINHCEVFLSFTHFLHAIATTTTKNSTFDPLPSSHDSDADWCYVKYAADDRSAQMLDACSKWRLKFVHMYLLHAAESFLRGQQVLGWLKKFPAFYGTRMFITAFTSARHLSLFWAR